MNINEIVEQFGDLKFVEQRELSKDYAEYVVLNDQFSSWTDVLTRLLDSPKKPEGVKPTKEDETITDTYGGIFDSQTLFQKDFEDHIIIAMIWPWGDRKHTTLKIAVLPNDGN